ncbi:hypothetical protein Sgly_2395 [Syntrophobotulus glycolicus DSM 8271]|uniref:Uncharacterized protein n=1 Tax=Syntrophobotulus glycolicus (strain DSM 8271 / FlGlyR) TaxID=645991 RepID=F0SUW6_SYNGF|nr:hypothetical protein Sgly_2395 [Syntrophobotulus glycolicus DSM 8271]
MSGAFGGETCCPCSFCGVAIVTIIILLLIALGIVF